MTKNIFSIWKIALFGGLLAFSLLLWLNDYVGYTATSTILINGHNGNQDDVLVKTVAAFTSTDVFEKRTLGSSRLQASVLGDEEHDVQSAVIQNIRANGGKKGSIVTVTAIHEDKEIAKIVSVESTETLLRMSRLYLGDETELTTTVIETGIVTKGLINPWLYFSLSIATALGLTLIMTLLEPLVSFIKGRIKQYLRMRKTSTADFVAEIPESLDQRFVPQKLDATFLYQGGELPTETTLSQPKASQVIKDDVFGKTPLQSVSVPMEDLPFTFESPEEEQIEASNQNQNIPEAKVVQTEKEPSSNPDMEADREPSVLEYKRRLNELLAQK